VVWFDEIVQNWKRIFLNAEACVSNVAGEMEMNEILNIHFVEFLISI
jgi:hypothetical protein